MSQLNWAILFLNGCITPRIFGDMSKIYGTDINHREINIISMNGAYMGYADGRTEVFHAETFLSSAELGKDQLFLDASKSEDLKLWKSPDFVDFSNSKIRRLIIRQL